jgi:hypothetical protein
MITVKSYIRLLSLITFSIICLSCHNDLSSSSDFLIKVDSINVPKSVNSETPFDIEFFGTIGFDGCTEFKTFNQIYDNNDITIEAWGTYNNQTKCPTVMVSLDGQKLNLTIYSRGVYTILIREPDSFSIVRQITVN